jgi:hypothetical protein
VVVHEGVIREKPLTVEEARHFIKSYANSPAVTVGACVCACLDTGALRQAEHPTLTWSRALEVNMSQDCVFLSL